MTNPEILVEIKEARESLSKLPPNQQRVVALGEFAVLVHDGHDPHLIFRLMKLIHPEAADALDALLALP